MLSIQKLVALCLLSSLILLVSADPDLNPCDGSDWESENSDFLTMECIRESRDNPKIMSGCIEKRHGIYMIRCSTYKHGEFFFKWYGRDPVYTEEPESGYVKNVDIDSDKEETKF